MLLVVPQQAIAQAEPEAGDQYWSDEFWGRGFNGRIDGGAEDGQGNFYVWGDFTAIDGQPANHIALWDGTSWSPLAQEISLAPNDVVVDSQGRIFAARAASVLLWDGTSWSDLELYDHPDWQGGVFEMGVSELAISADDEVAVVAISSRTNGAVFTWDGTEWAKFRDLPSRLHGMKAAYGPDGRLYVSDHLGVSNAGPDGPMSTPESRIASQLIVDASGTLFVPTYNFDTGRGHRLWMWDGESWTLSPDQTSVGRLSLDSTGQLIAGDGQSIVRWNGTSWDPIADSGSDGVDRVSKFGEGYVVTSNTYSSEDPPELAGLNVFRIAQWRDGTWSEMYGSEYGAGVKGSVDAIATLPDGTVFVGGTLVSGGDVQLMTAGYWDGEKWTAANTSGPVVNFVVTSDGVLIAQSDIFEYWDGQEWQFMSPALRGGDTRFLVADGLGGVIATGNFNSTPDGERASGIARWDGASWSAIGDGISETFSGGAVTADNLGNIFVASSKFPINLWSWDGTSWLDRGPAYSDVYTDLAISPKGDLVATGISPNSDPWLSTWDGEAWVPIGPPELTTTPLQIEYNSCGELVLLTYAELMKRNSSGAWETLGSVKGGTGFALAANDVYLRLFRYGPFVGGTPQTGFAHWSGPGSGAIAEASSVAEIVQACDYEQTKHGDVLRLYQAFFDREPDVSGARYWIDINTQGQSLDQIADYFTLSDEFANNYAGTTNREYLAAVYENVLGREYDQDGFDYWLELLDDGELTRGGVVRWIAANTEFVLRYPYSN